MIGIGGRAEKALPKALGQPSGLGAPAGAIFSTTWGTLRTRFFDVFGSFGSREASGRVETIDWDRGIGRKRTSEGSGTLVWVRSSDGSIFRTTLGTLGRGFFGNFGSFGGAEASGRVGTIDWETGTHGQRASEGSGASDGRAKNGETAFTASSTIRIPDRKF